LALLSGTDPLEQLGRGLAEAAQAHELVTEVGHARGDIKFLLFHRMFDQTFDTAYNRAARVANGKGPRPHWGAMTLTVQEKGFTFHNVTFAHGFEEQAGATTQRSMVFTGINDEVFFVISAEHLEAKIPGQSLRTMVPEDNLPVAIHQANSGVEVFDYGTKQLGIVQLQTGHRHGDLYCLSAKKEGTLWRGNGRSGIS